MIKSQLKHFKDPKKIKKILVCSGQGQFKADSLNYLNQYKNLNSISRILNTTNDLLPNLKLSNYITKSNGVNNANDDSNSLNNLQKTSVQQPMLILMSYINYQLYKELYGIELTDHCDYMLGHSLGEITCLVLQDIISFEQGILIAHERGKLMESIVAKELSKQKNNNRADNDNYTMTVLMYKSTHYEFINNYLINELNVNISNYNNYQQVVISGLKSEIELKLNKLRDYLAKSGVWKTRVKAIDLNINIPFHNPILQPIEPFLQRMFDDAIDYSLKTNLKVPVISNVNGELVNDPKTQVNNIVKVTSKPVQFVKCLENFQQFDDGENYQFIQFGASTLGIVNKYYEDLFKLKKENPREIANVSIDQRDAVRDLIGLKCDM